jgi:hypothetical protein
MCKKSIFLFCFAMVLGLRSASYGVVVGDFEGSLDGWGPADATLSLSTTGATSGTGAMQVDGPGNWHINSKVNIKPHRQILGVPGAVITADVTAFDADMTTTWMQVQMVINAQNNDDNGANNNIGWQQLGLQAVTRDGLPHTHVWVLPEDLSLAIAGTDEGIGWFELALVTNLNGESVTKFYIDNVQLVSELVPPPSVVIGDWENTDDGWYLGDSVPAGSSMTYSDTNGVTLNDYSLKLQAPPGWVQGFRLDLQSRPELVDTFRNGTRIQLDVTRLADEWEGEPSNGWSGLNLVINAGGDGWSIWDNLGYGGDWKYHHGDKTLTAEWAYSASLAKIDFDNLQWLEIWPILNSDPDYTSGGIYYLDNCRIPITQQASKPNPPDGATDLPRDVGLGWKPGKSAGTHDVYVGTDSNDVSNVTQDNLASYPNVVYMSVDVNSYEPGILELGRTYYWRVDEVNEPDIMKGVLWSFTVGDFLVVDDFEDYSTDNPIWENWIDGLGFVTPQGVSHAGKGTGSEVGDGGTVSYTEESIVSGGSQSMPVFRGKDDVEFPS